MSYWRRPIRARIREDLLDTIDGFFGHKEGHKDDREFLALCERIAGKEVDLVFIGDDAFEAIDNNYWLPDCCWTEVHSNARALAEAQKGGA